MAERSVRADTWLADPAGRRSRVESGVSTATPSNAASYQSIANRRRSVELPDTLIDHGYVRFPLSRQRNSKWARVTNKATPDSIVSMLRENWKLTPPSVLISVTGDAANNQDGFPERVHAAFRRRLREVVHRTKAWIITGGTKAGVMKMVGDMLRESEVSVLKFRPAPLAAHPPRPIEAAAS